jgi:putative phosphoesterase
MRLAVLADIHGNLPALQAVLADLRQTALNSTDLVDTDIVGSHLIGTDPVGIIIAGDSTGGLHPEEVIKRLRTLDSWMIRGNSEGYFIAYDTGEVPPAWRVSHQWSTLRWSYHRLGRETLDFIASLPEQRVVHLDGAAPIRVVHGSLNNPHTHLVPDNDATTLEMFKKAGLLPANRQPARLDDTLAQMQEPVLVCGHSHIPWAQEQDGRLVMNPGSVGAPINGDPRAQYAILTWEAGRWHVEHRAVEYDLDQVRSAYLESGLLAAGGAFARALLQNIETGRNVPGYFLSHVYGMAQESGWTGGEVVPDSVWERAVITFDWQTGR